MRYRKLAIICFGVCAGSLISLARSQPGGGNCANCAPKKAPAKTTPAVPPAPVLSPVILSVRNTGTVGGDLVRGSATGVSSGDTIRAVVLDPLGNDVQDAPGYLDAKSGKFYVAFDKPLGAEQFVRVFVTRKGVDVAASNPFMVPSVTSAAMRPVQSPPESINSTVTVMPPGVLPAPAPPGPVAQATPGSPVPCDFAVEHPKYQAAVLQLQAGNNKISVPSPFAAGTAQVCVGPAVILPANPDIKTRLFPFQGSPFDVQLPDKVLENQTVSVVVWKDGPAGKDDVYVFRATVPGDPCVAPTAAASLKIPSIRQGDRKLAGDAPDGAGKLRVCVGGKPVDLTGGKTSPYKNAKFETELLAAVASPKTPVQVVFVPDDPKTSAVSANISVLSSCYERNSLLFGPMPKEGDTTIKGLGEKSVGDTKCAVSVIVDGDQVDIKDAQNKPVSSTDVSEKGEFTANLTAALQSGQCVTLVQFESGSHPNYSSFKSARCNEPFRPVEPKEGEAVEVTQIVKSAYVAAPLNLGRWRAYFAGGVVLAHDQGNFNSQHLFLAFDVDRNWLWGGLRPYEEDSKGSYRRLMFNTYFETRLTSIPVVGTDGKNIDSFVTSQKAGVLQGGAYMPILLTTWRSHQTHNALSLGPIAKIGFETPVDSLDASGVVQPGGRRSFYTFFAYGARLGTHRISASKSLAPELLSYFDIVFGRFSSMDSDPLLNNPRFAGNNRFLPWQFADTFSDGRGQYLRYARPWRIGIEGTLKIPGYPFVVGVSANVHQNFGIGNSNTLGGTERDDLRFFLGTRFDFGSLAQKLKTLSNTSGGQ